MMEKSIIDKIGAFIKELRPPPKNDYMEIVERQKGYQIFKTTTDFRPIHRNVKVTSYSLELLKDLQNSNLGKIDACDLIKIEDLGITKKNNSNTHKIETIISNSRKVRTFKNQNNNNTLVSPKENRENEISEGNIVVVRGDGNCFFRCISQYYKENQESHIDIRNQIIHTMNCNRNFYEAYIEGSFENHITNMSRCSGGLLSWATDAEIMATSEHFNIDVYVRSKIGLNWNWYRYSIYEECDHRRGFITIQHENSHYNLLINIDRPCRCVNRIQGSIARELGDMHKNSSTRISSNMNLIKPKVIKSTKITNSRRNRKSEKRYSNLITLEGNAKKIDDIKGIDIVSNYISLVSININGIRGKKDTLAAFLDTKKPAIVAIQETKIDRNITSTEIIPKELDYIIYRKDRTDGGGGVMLLVKKTLEQVALNELDNDSESIWVKVKIDGSYHYIGNWYRAPHEKVQNIENLRRQLEIIRNMSNKEKLPNIHILGDLNYRHVSWPKKVHREGRQLYPSEGKSLMEIMDDHSLTQLVDFPTREAAILDLIITTTPDKFEEIYSPYKFSDHSAVECTLRKAKSNKERGKRVIKKYNQGDFNKIREEAAEFARCTYLNGMENNRDVNGNWDLIMSFINNTIDKNIPTKVTKQNSLPWVTNAIRRLIRRRDKAHKKSKQTGYNSKWKKLQAKVTKEVKVAKENYMKINLENAKANPKRFWRYIKNVRNEANHIPALNHNGRLCETNKEKANALNEQFSKVFTKKIYNTVPLQTPLVPKMDRIEVTTEGVMNLLKNLDVSKAAGPDEMHPKILKEIAKEFTPVLTHFLRQSLTTNSVPNSWETATICAIHKKGDRSDPANYRPVSLTSIVCKMLEHIICSSIMKHLEKHNIITDKQHAFRKYHSCETQLCTVVNDWAKEMDRGNQVDIFFLDLEKAFDTVPHELLKTKLHRYGVDKMTLNWIDSFLCQRKQQVRVEGEYSKWSKVESGVPQGSVLGPLLFSIYMNDIISGIDSEIRLFADDCVVYRPIKNAQDAKILQKDIEKLERWANKWGMRFQPYKCHIMHLTRNRTIMQNKYILKDTVLKTVENTKYLGVTISKDLRWNAHINNISTKANSLLNLLKRNIKSSDQNSKENAYKSLIRPILEYASSVWDPHHEALKLELERVQKRAARFITNNFNYNPGSMSSIINTLKWKSLSERRMSSSLILFYKGLKGQARIPLENLEIRANRGRSQREMTFEIPYARTDVYKYSFIPKTLRLWNKLPQSTISRAENGPNRIEIFARELKQQT